jgi:hypothetical protein
MRKLKSTDANCRGTTPTQAAKSRPRRKAAPLPMAATVVVPGGSEAFRINYLLPAGGGGLRFQLSKAYRVNLRADFARGKDTWTWSMGVGEAF